MFGCMKILLRWVLSFFLLSSFACSSARFSPSSAPFQGITPHQLYEEACKRSDRIHSTSGEVSLKIKSKDLSGQFNASVKAETSHVLNLEVDHPLGGLAARVRVEGDSFEVQNLSENPPHIEKGRRAWSGVPVEFATSLFLGKVPCPNSLGRSSQLSITPEGELRVKLSDQEEWIYRFRVWQGRPWPEALDWKPYFLSRDGDQKVKIVEMSFDDPDSVDRSPRKWEIRSQEGFIKVRWKDRASD